MNKKLICDVGHFLNRKDNSFSLKSGLFIQPKKKSPAFAEPFQSRSFLSDAYLSSFISTLRFFARPASVSFGAMGFDNPYH